MPYVVYDILVFDIGGNPGQYRSGVLFSFPERRPGTVIYKASCSCQQLHRGIWRLAWHNTLWAGSSFH